MVKLNNKEGFILFLALAFIILFIISFADHRFQQSFDNSQIGLNESSSFTVFFMKTSTSWILIIGSSLFIALLIYLCYWIFFLKIDSPLVTTFDSNIEAEINGKSISDMITAELKRIKNLHDKNETNKYEIKLKEIITERLPIAPGNIEYEFLMEQLDDLEKESLIISDSIGKDLGKLSMAGFEVALGPIIMVLNQYRTIGDKGCIIHGSLQKYGSQVYIESHIRRKKKILNCHIRKVLANDEISDVIRDLAYKIVFEILKDSKDEREEGFFRGFPKSIVAQIKSIIARINPSNNNNDNLGEYADQISISKGKLEGILNEKIMKKVKEDSDTLIKNLEVSDNGCPISTTMKYFYSEDDIKNPKDLIKNLSRLLGNKNLLQLKLNDKNEKVI